MKTFGTKSAAALVGLAFLASAGVTMADVVSVTFDMGAVSPQTFGNNTVSVASSKFTEGFTLGQATTVTLQDLTWTSSGNAFGFSGMDLSRDLTATINGITKSSSLTQYGVLYDLDPSLKSPETLSVGASPTTVIQLGQYLLDITPNILSSGSPGTFNMTASVTVSAVPETTTMLAGAGAVGLLFLGAGAHSKRNVFRIGKAK